MAAPIEAALVIDPVKIDEAPLPMRIARKLCAAMEDGQLSPGSRLPSEPILARQLGVSRASLREALQLLERERLLTRRPGVGTYVTPQAVARLQRGLEELTSTTWLIESQGFRAGSIDVEVRRESANAEMAAALGLPEGVPLVHLSRTRLAGESPFTQCEEFLPLALFERAGVDPSELRNMSSLFGFMKERLGVEVATAETEVLSVIATSRLARRLRIRRGHPLLLLKHVHLDLDHVPVLIAHNWHNPDIIRFRVTRRIN